ncbi:MAG: hypothetical protein IKG56_01365 [Clostridia bacterium]|nr:hypothetical protein [Clostridia bacterium]
MEIAALCFIILLVLIVFILMIYNYYVHKKIESFTNLNQRVKSLNVLQEFMNTLGENATITEKLESINDILINKYSIKYSTIVVFNGAEYEIKASNVDMKHWDSLKSLQSDPVFAESIQTATPKYITVDNDSEKLPYQKMEFGRAKCIMFFPLYVDNVYIGYWVIEGSEPHEFDSFDTTILEVVRDNIVTILKTVANQSTIENIVRDDQFSGLKSAEYLYGEGKKIIDQYTTSAICLFKIVNLPEVNTNISRKTGNNMVTFVSNYVKNNLANNYVFVRYMGPKFAIIFSGVDVKGVSNFMGNMKNKLEMIRVQYADDYKGQTSENVDNGENTGAEQTQVQQQPKFITPKVKVVISTYYKGTSLDGALKKIEEYIDKSNDNTISVV